MNQIRVPFLLQFHYGTARIIMVPSQPYGPNGLGHSVPRYHAIPLTQSVWDVEKV